MDIMQKNSKDKVLLPKDTYWLVNLTRKWGSRELFWMPKITRYSIYKFYFILFSVGQAWVLNFIPSEVTLGQHF